MLAGLDHELEILSGWLSLLTAPGDLAGTWGLPSVSGVILAGPAGVGRSELVNAASKAAGARVEEISLELVFKPEKLLDLAEKAVKGTTGPTVIFLDRLDAVAGDEGMFKSQTGAILRWFLDAVAEKPRTACVLGVSSVEA
ncbi:MAG: AAA family ATPase, partial [Gemmatimonadetes bacterium]|nr:AAA family ATPase [Gemmatimonadota bacterium]NIY42895.1 AAA family ATPase [Gemmatimonadota bacterium]